ncbi:unnamed protein product [Lota lota]
MGTEKAELRTGAVHGLFTSEGQALQGPADLRTNQYYVQGPADPRTTQYYVQGPADPRTTQYYVQGPGLQPVGPLQGSHQKRPDCSGEEQRRSALYKKDKTFKGCKGSVFNGKSQREEMAGAVEVLEERPLKVDLPIGQVKATEVEDEHNKSATPLQLQGQQNYEAMRPESGRGLRRSAESAQQRPARSRVGSPKQKASTRYCSRHGNPPTPSRCGPLPSSQ